MVQLPRVVIRRLAHPEPGDPFRGQQLTVAALAAASGVGLGLLATADTLPGLLTLVVSVLVVVLLRRWLSVLAERLRQVEAVEEQVFTSVGRPRGRHSFHWRQRMLADVLTLVVVAGALVTVGRYVDGADAWVFRAAAVVGAVLGLATGESVWFVVTRCFRADLGWSGSYGRP